jgi:phage shock protein C
MASYCSSCGTSLPTGARFCAACGNAVSEPGPIPGSYHTGPPRRPLGPLLRPIAGRKVAGVCQGLSNRYGWDVTLTRIITVLLAVAAFPVGLVAYGLFWLMVPEEPRTSSPATNLNTVP